MLSLARSFAARIVVAEGMDLTVGATQLIGVPPPPAVGSPVTIRWSGRRGRYSAVTTLIGVDATQFAVWILRAGGSVQIEQRRRFARAWAEGTVQINLVNPAVPASDVVLVGDLIDISEGAIRCRLPSKGFDQTLALQVRLQIGERLLSLKATVLKVGPYVPPPVPGAAPAPAPAPAEAPAREGEAEDPGLEAVLTIEPDEVQATALRRYVMDLQRRERALKAERADGAL